MAVSTAYSGSYTALIELINTLTGDLTGSNVAQANERKVFTAAGGTAPTLSGFLSVDDLSVTAATDYLLAATTAPFGAFSHGFAPTGLKLKLIYIKNNHASATLKLARKAAAGVTIFSATADEIVIEPGGHFIWYAPAGGAALTTTVNDGITLTPSVNPVTADIIIGYGA